MDQGESLVENLRRAFDAAEDGPGERLVLAMADIPLVTPDELARLVAAVDRSPADACIALAHPRASDAYGGLLEGYRRSMIIARGGPYLLGNMFALKRCVLEFADVIGQGRHVRHQSKGLNVVRAFLRFLALGPRATPALVTWLRLVTARAQWLRRHEYAWTPWVAPGTDLIERGMTALTRGRVSAEFVDVGADGACYDIDDLVQYEAVRALLVERQVTR